MRNLALALELRLQYYWGVRAKAGTGIQASKGLTRPRQRKEGTMRTDAPHC